MIKLLNFELSRALRDELLLLDSQAMKNRWIVLSASVLFQTVLGGIYAWSTFSPSLMEVYGLNNAQSSFIFGLTIAVFTLSMIYAGRLLRKRGPRLTANLSAFLYMTGYLLASVSNGRFILLLISLGVITGAGIGFGYVGPISVSMKWFPEKKGLITGIAVAGFGGGAVLLSTVAGIFIDSGTDVLLFFRWMGILLGAVLLTAAQGMAEPTKTGAGTLPSSVRVSDKARTPQFLLITAALFAGTFAGLLVIGNLVPMVREAGLSGAHAIAAVSVFAAGNAVGRISWGHLFDHFGFASIPSSLLFFAAAVFILLLPLSSWLLLLMSAVLGFGFGYCFVIYASAISRFYGIDSFPVLYPLAFLGYGAAGIFGPVAGGQLADSTGSFDSAIIVSLAVLVAAGASTLWGLRFFEEKSRIELPLQADLQDS